MKVLLIPLDNRPVTYLLPQLLSRIAGIEVAIPPRTCLGSLNQPAQIGSLLEWTYQVITKEKLNGVLVCLDALLYGGLISSRTNTSPLKELLERSSCINNWRKALRTSCRLFAQSSIMRISNNYDATEEKDYWASYGREIYLWSEYLHRLSLGHKLTPGALASAENKIPAEVRKDYLETRKRNFLVNQNLLGMVQSQTIDFLIFSLDDSGDFGLNVLEQERLSKEAKDNHVKDKVLCYPGSDEVLCTLLARLLVLSASKPPKAHLDFSPSSTAQCLSRYEGQTIEKTVHAQLNACGISVCPSSANDADFHIIVHGNKDQQGDHIRIDDLPDVRFVDTQQSVRSTIALMEKTHKPCVLCDVAYANGSDPLLIETLFQRKDLIAKLWAYAGWNTTGNTVGSALSMGVARWFASTKGTIPSDEALKQSLFIRFADDYAYQSKIRAELGQPLSLPRVKVMFEPYLRSIASALDFEPKCLTVGFPWHRPFEIELSLSST